jgi:hypothetical protein
VPYLIKAATVDRRRQQMLLIQDSPSLDDYERRSSISEDASMSRVQNRRTSRVIEGKSKRSQRYTHAKTCISVVTGAIIVFGASLSPEHKVNPSYSIFIHCYFVALLIAFMAVAAIFYTTIDWRVLRITLMHPEVYIIASQFIRVFLAQAWRIVTLPPYADHPELQYLFWTELVTIQVFYWLWLFQDVVKRLSCCFRLSFTALVALAWFVVGPVYLANLPLHHMNSTVVQLCNLSSEFGANYLSFQPCDVMYQSDTVFVTFQNVYGGGHTVLFFIGLPYFIKSFGDLDRRKLLLVKRSMTLADVYVTFDRSDDLDVEMYMSGLTKPSEESSSSSEESIQASQTGPIEHIVDA